MDVMSETYKKPFPVYLVVNKYTVPTSDDDRVFIPRDRVPMIPIPQKPKPMSDGGTDNDHLLYVTSTVLMW